MKLQLARSMAVLLCCIVTHAPGAQQSEPTTDEFFSTNAVRDVRIKVAESDWEELCSESRNMANSLDLVARDSPYHYVKATVTIDGVSLGKIGLRKKGFLGSQDSFRPSLKIRVDKYQKGRTFAGLDRLTLNNNKQDRSLMSQHLTYDSFRRAGIAAPRLSFAHVWVNDRDLGVYSNVESARPAFLKHHFGGDTGKMYEGTVVDFIGERISRFERKFDDGKDDDRKALKAIAEIVKDKDIDIEELERFVDVDEFLKYWAMESLIGFWDGYCGNQNNYFIYAHHDDGRLHFIPWGADVAFVKQFIGQLFKAGSPECVSAFALLPNRLYQNEAMQDRYYATLDKLLSTVWDEERLVKETHRIDELLKPHASDAQPDHLSASKDIRGFIKSRRAEFKKELADGRPEIKFHKRKTVSTSAVGAAKGSFKTQWTPANDAEASVTLDLQLDGETIKLVDVKPKAFSGGGNPMMGLMNAVTVQLTATREDNKKPVVLSIVVTGSVFTTDRKHPATAHGTFVEGRTGFFRSPRELGVAGKVEFSNASRVKGEPVEGKFTLRLLQMDDGHPKKPKKAKQN